MLVSTQFIKSFCSKPFKKRIILFLWISLIPLFLLEMIVDSKEVLAGDVNCSLVILGCDINGTDDIVDNSINSADITDNTITSTDIADDTISTADIANGTILSEDLSANIITASELADLSVDTNAIQDDAVTAAKLNADTAGNGLSQSVGGALQVNAGDGIEIIGDAVSVNLGDASSAGNTNSGLEIIAGELVTDVDDVGIEVGSQGLQIKDNGVTTSKIATDAVTANELADNAVDTNAILDNAVTTAKLADGAVTTIKILDNAVTTAKLADGAVTTIKISDSAVTTAKLADGAVTTIKISDNAVTTDKIADNAVTTAKLNDDAVTTDKIADNAVTTDKIADGAVTAAKLAPGVISSASIADNSITNQKIANNSVSFNKLGTDVQNRIISLEDSVGELKQGVALAMAVANAPILLQGDNMFSISLGMGFYDDQAAGALKGAVKLSDQAILTGSLAISEDTIGGGLGIGIGF